MKCDICGRDTGTLGYRHIEGVQRKCCLMCMEDIDNKEESVKLNIPQNIVFTARVAKMGPQRHFNIPISQRPFLKLDKQYIIIVKDPLKEAERE